MSEPDARFARLCQEEPFRLFFPLGLLVGLLGVSLWPLFFAGITRTYPATVHARLMIEGMMTSFIFGFLGTAGPRVMSVPHFTGGEVLRLLGALSGAVLAHLVALHSLGDSLFLLGLLLFVVSLARRFRAREDSPPPNFALVGLGLLNGLAGAALLVFCQWTATAPTLYRLGSSLLNVGFVLLPLLGVAPFFIRRLLDLPTDPAAAENRASKAALAIGVGLLIDLSLVLELFSTNSIIPWLRCAAAAIYLFLTMPLAGQSMLATGLRMALVTLPAALGLVAFLPGYRISALHVLFIGGFSLAVFAVATRVVLGHSGNLPLVQRRRWLFLAALILLITAMVSRFVADFVATRNEHLVGAALAWLAAAGLWAALVLPNVRRVEQD